MRMVSATAEVMGTDLSPEALMIFVSVLAAMDLRVVRHALERTAVEVEGSGGFAPKLTLQDVLSRTGMMNEAQAAEYDATLAWDLAEKLVGRYGRTVDGDVVLRPLVSKPKEDCKRCNGVGWMLLGTPGGDRFVKDCTCRSREELPEIAERLEDTVRRIGGWAALKEIPPERYPFVKRDFLREYRVWRKLESLRVDSGREMIVIGRIGEEDRKVDLERTLDKILSSK